MYDNMTPGVPWTQMCVIRLKSNVPILSAGAQQEKFARGAQHFLMCYWCVNSFLCDK